LQVSVHRDHNIAARLGKASGKGCRLSKVASQLDNGEARVFFGNFLEQGKAAVARTIIDHNHLIGTPIGIQRIGQRLIEMGNTLFFVQEGNHDRDSQCAIRSVDR
jgi:hypothetical protein